MAPSEIFYTCLSEMQTRALTRGASQTHSALVPDAENVPRREPVATGHALAAQAWSTI